MISSIHYGGRAKVKRGDKEVLVPIQPQTALKVRGPFIQVSITQPRIIAEKLKAEGKDIPKVTVNALIDTGAFGSAITPKVAKELGLIQTGFQKVTSVQDQQEHPAYFAFITFPWGNGKEVPVVALPLKGFDCLIGREILRHWYLTYNGPEGVIVVCD